MAFMMADAPFAASARHMQRHRAQSGHGLRLHSAVFPTPISSLQSQPMAPLHADSGVWVYSV